jgi:hypothetical protein
VITESRDAPPKRASRGHNASLSPVRPRGRRSNDTSAVRGEFWQEQGPIAQITKEPAVSDQVLSFAGPEAEQSSLADLEHPVTAYLNGLAPSSRRPQLAALEAIARRSTQVFTAESMPWQRIRRPPGAQDPEPALGALPASHRQPHALRPAWRAEDASGAAPRTNVQPPSC